MQRLNNTAPAQIVEQNKEKEIIVVLKKKKQNKSVTWDISVIDNEFMKKKKSNKCCIYHKTRKWDESDTDETSSDDEDENVRKHKNKNKNKNKNTCTKTETVTMTETQQEKKSTEQKSVTWDDSVIDNEFMNKKKSNKCCIYKKPHRWDESSSESDSSDYHNDPNYTKTNINHIKQLNNEWDVHMDDKTEHNIKSQPKMTSNQAKSEKHNNSIQTTDKTA